MNYMTTQMNTARQIARVAEKQISTRTGMRVKVMLCTTEDRKTPEKMLSIIANALNMSTASYLVKSRKRDIVELRFLAALLLRKFYPRVTLKQIAAFFGGQDHTSIINGLIRASELLETNDTKFTNKYNTALNTVNLWLKEQ